MNNKALFIFILSFIFIFILSSFFIIKTANAASCSIKFSCSTSTSAPASAAKPLTSYCIITGAVQSIGTCINASLPIAFIGLLFSVLMVGLAYMIGEVLNISGFKGWYRGELWELIKSTLLVVIIFSLIIEIGGIANALVGNPSSSTSSTSISSTLSSLYTSIQTNYIAPQLATAYTAYWGILGTSVGLGLIKSFSVMLYIPLPILPIPLLTFGALAFGVQENLFLSNILESVHGTYSFVNQAFEFITVPLLMFFQFINDLFIPLIGLSLSILLPMGIIFRAIPFLRPMGGMLIAISIAISLVFPTLLLSINMPIQNFLHSILVPPTAPTTLTFSTNPIICGFVNNFISIVESPICNIINSPVVTDTAAFLSGVLFGMFGSLSGVFAVFNFILFLILPLIVEFLLLIIDLVITIVIAQNIAKLLGGTIKLSLGRLRLA